MGKISSWNKLQLQREHKVCGTNHDYKKNKKISVREQIMTTKEQKFKPRNKSRLNREQKFSPRNKSRLQKGTKA
jgi:hypothetical protein